ncbi:hypothetical protein [Mycobacterium botniense]|uniref:Uncharacterized protein n=1 Tax=Mycobacterium botniense TaxID=84962 RepID=A0A7I9XV92_9MYCO|nr:hypothetical protein [Mycobacterium botniense]GFG73506.1 hypothetical protein MBOT_08710 [Mycobacterium botniense]
MKTNEKWLRIGVVGAAPATCAVAAVVTHNHTSTPLTLAQALVTAVIPLGLLGYLSVYWREHRVSNDDRAGKGRANREHDR